MGSENDKRLKDLAKEAPEVKPPEESNPQKKGENEKVEEDKEDKDTKTTKKLKSKFNLLEQGRLKKYY